jgi:serine/threonine protein kinase
MKELLGRGAFGRVRRIVDNASKQSYAMKIITKPVTEAERAHAVDWKAEVELNALVDSEFVVKIFECYETTEEAMIVMEFCDKGTVADYVLQLQKENKKLSEYVSLLPLLLLHVHK